MSMIRTFNSGISNAINETDENYTALFGAEEFTPEATIVESADFNCGGLSNELEYLRSVSEYYYQSFDLDIAEDENLDSLITAFVDLPRRNVSESDAVYRSRYRALVTANSNPRRITRWALMDAISEFGLDTDYIQIVEKFDTEALYFEIRIEGAIDYDNSVFVDSLESGFVGQYFIGGSGVGAVLSYLGALIDKIKPAGVDYDILFVVQTRFTHTVDAVIGSIQKYAVCDAVIKASSTVTKNINAEVIV